MKKLFAIAVVVGCLFVACKHVESLPDSSEVALEASSVSALPQSSLPEPVEELKEDPKEEPVDTFVMVAAESYTPQANGTMYTDLSFLSDSQLTAYEQAMYLYPFMTFDNESWPHGEYRDDKPQPEHPMEGAQYYPAGGEYEKWDDFYAYWTETFTAGYFDKLLEGYGSFVEHEGYTWYAGGAACGHGTVELAFEVMTATGQEMRFIAYGYGQGHSGEYYEDSYEVALVNNGNGWRCSYLSMLGTGER